MSAVMEKIDESAAIVMRAALTLSTHLQSDSVKSGAVSPEVIELKRISAFRFFSICSHSLCLSPPLTHTHTHTHSFYLSPFPPPPSLPSSVIHSSVSRCVAKETKTK